MQIFQKNIAIDERLCGGLINLCFKKYIVFNGLLPVTEGGSMKINNLINLLMLY